MLAPGVLEQTGIETGELLYSVTQKLRPAALIVVDALASRKAGSSGLYRPGIGYRDQPGIRVETPGLKSTVELWEYRW